MEGPQPVKLRVNGHDHELPVAPDAPLLLILRNDLGLNGPKFGCGLAQCGACTVIIDGKPARSCVLPAGGLEGHDILTLEGLGTRTAPHPVQQAFIAENATQCGFCLNGMIMTVAALLGHEPNPSDARIRQALRYNLCRCGSHVDVLEAAHQAGAAMREESPR